MTPLAAARPLDGPLEERARRAVREEMALTLADAVLRRLDLGTAGPPAADELDAVARVMAAELGWDAARERAERAALAALLAGPLALAARRPARMHADRLPAGARRAVDSS